MQRAIRITTTALALGVALFAAPTAALACGGGFGQGLSISPSQKIVVVFKNGVQTYIFSPHFCGKAAEFGLILPVPDKLAGSPTLADKALFTELETISAPKIVKQPRCAGDRSGMDAGFGGGRDGGQNGVTVIDRGQVGMFDWALLKADNLKAFTDWLDAAKYPYDKSTAAIFEHYVTKAWYFVAFKVTADSKAPPAGSQLCGDLGPISLSFPTAAPVIPARIAAAAETSGYWSFGWRVFAIAAKQQRTTGEFSPQLRFSAALADKDLGAAPQLAKVAAKGDRLTKLDLQFNSGSVTSDITLADDPGEADFRQTITETYTVQCDGGVVRTEGGAPVINDAGLPVRPSPKDGESGGCAIAGPAPFATGALALLVLVVLGRCLRRRRH